MCGDIRYTYIHNTKQERIELKMMVQSTSLTDQINDYKVCLFTFLGK